jgi:hypothetical protein
MAKFSAARATAEPETANVAISANKLVFVPLIMATPLPLIQRSLLIV